MENFLKNGHIKYKFQRILLNKNLNKQYIFSHNEILCLLRGWNGSTNQNKKHLILRTNYPWLFSSRNEIKNNENLDEHKTLPIIALSEIGRKSLTALKNVILHDKYAHLIELMSSVGLARKWTKGLSKVQTNVKKYPCIVHGVSIMMKKKIMYTSSSQQPEEHAAVDIKLQEVVNAIYANDKPYLDNVYGMLLQANGMKHADVDKILSSPESIHFIRSICEIVLGNNRKIISYLQGKESAVRTAVPKRVLSCRAQICLAPQLTATQIGIPYWWAKYIHFEHDATAGALRICDDSDEIFTQMPRKYMYPLNGQRIIAKRDPIIHILAFCIFDEVFFHRDSRFKIGAESLKKMAADFDGDTFILYFVHDLKVIHELDYNASPKYSMALHGQCRINLIESIVLGMYRRNVDEKIPHWRLYNFIRKRFIYRWLVNIRNASAIEAIADMSHGELTLGQLYRMVEPTDVILSEMLMVLYYMYGSTESYRFYCRILELCMELSVEYENATLYQADLPCDYTLVDNLLNVNLLAVSFSCAKGSIHSYKSLLDRLYEEDKSTRLCTRTSDNNNINNNNDDNFDYEKLIEDITDANIFAAKKSKQVPQQGYNLFKDTIEGDLMNFGGNRLNYENTILIENIYLYIPIQYILSSTMAYTILYQ